MSTDNVEQKIKETIREFEKFHNEHKPHPNCKAITKREVALFALFKMGKIEFVNNANTQSL